MGKAKRFNSYDSDVAQQRKIVQSYGEARQKLSIGSSFRSAPLSPPTAVSGAAGSGGLTEPLLQTVTTVTTATEPTTTDIDCSLGNIFKITLDEDITLDFTDETASKYQLIHLILIQDGTGGRTVTWPAALTATPNISSTASEQTDVILYTIDQGTTWHFSVGTSGASTAGASKQLDNLSSPVLNTNINFNSNAPTNFNGYTSQIVGNTLVNDATGATWTLPTGDQYDFKINGTSQFVISSVGVAVEESIQLSDTSGDPATNGEIQRNGTDVKVYTGGGVVNLSDMSTLSLPFDDNQVIIQDESDNTKTLTFNLSLMGTGHAHLISFASSSANRTYTFPDATGTVILSQNDHSITGAWTFANNIDFDANGTRDIGTTTTHANDIFTENLTFRGSGNSITSTRPMVTADSSNMIFHVPAADDYIFQVAGSTTKMQFNTTGASDDIRIRAGASRVLGFITDSSATTLGTSGTIKIPVDGGSVGTAAAADTDFGDDVGCIGLYLNTIGSGNPTFCIKIDDGTGTDNRWSAITINRTTGALTGGILT